MTSTAPPVPVENVEKGTPRGPRRTSGRRKGHRLGGADRIIVALMVIVPTALVVCFVWLPAVSTILLSFTNWDGIGGLSKIKWVGTQNFHNVISNYPPFQPAIKHNVIWLLFLFLIATPLGMFLAVLMDKEIRGSRIYQTAFFLPVVLSLALVGFIWQLIYSRDQGLLNAVLGTKIDWYGDNKWNLWAVLVASSWKHAGYIMLLYLAGLKGVDPSLREAAAIDGASETKVFFQIILPVMRPINLVVLVITVIEALRAFDLVWIVNKGRNGLELISTLVTSNVVGEASRIGFGSALATIMVIISSIFIAIYLGTVLREEKR